MNCRKNRLAQLPSVQLNTQVINSKERKEMVFDAFMLPCGYLFEGREGIMEIGNKTSFTFSLFVWYSTNIFLEE